MEPISPSLGQFSLSLVVADLAKSRAFYEALGFFALHVDKPGYGKTWLMLRHGDALIGLFHGTIERNTITFRPADTESVQRSAEARGVAFHPGERFATAFDPDGNPVVLDHR